jgi:DNA polymerase I - 3''-5'' exonuclease and polymerase domains
MSRTLFKVPTRETGIDADKSVLDKIAKRKKSTSVVTGTPSTISGKIALARKLIESKLGHLRDKFVSITDEQQLIDYIDKAIQNGKCAIDTETASLDTIDGHIAGVCLYTKGMKPAYIPCGHISPMTLVRLKTQLDYDVITRELQRAEDNCVKWLLHNAKFDMHVCYWYLNVLISPFWDTNIAGNLLNENEPHSLKVLWNKYCKEDDDDAQAVKFNTLFEKGIDFRMIPLDLAYLYAAFDALMTWELYEFQEPFLTENNPVCIDMGLTRVSKLWHNIELPEITTVFDMEREGTCIDTKYAKELHDKYTKELTSAEKVVHLEISKVQHKIDRLAVDKPKMYSKLSNPINIGSPTQLAILLYDVLGLTSNDKNSPRGTGEEIILAMNHPIAKAIIAYRKVSKLLSTYIDAIPQQISKRTGKLHASFNQYGAKTGRFSSSDPNLQNIPSKNHDIRKMFIVPEGYVMVGSDYSQQEPRCLAYMSGDESLLDAYRTGKDLYALIASTLYKVPYDECLEFRPDGTKNEEGKKRRNSVKPVVLGIMYGRGSASIAEQMGVSKKEAERVIADFFKHYPKVAQFVMDTQQKARDYGFVETAMGRKRRLPDMQLDEIELTPQITASSNNFNPLFDDEEDDDDVDMNFVPDDIYYKYAAKMRKAWGRKQKDVVKQEALQEGYAIKDNGGKIADAERQCVNSVIQGSSADITKHAMNQLHRDEELKSLGYKLIITVHDEVIGMCPYENRHAVAKRVQQVMVSAAQQIIDVPMKCDVEISYKWYGEEVA